MYLFYANLTLNFCICFCTFVTRFLKSSDQWVIHHPSDSETVTRQLTSSDLKLTHRCSFCFKVFNNSNDWPFQCVSAEGTVQEQFTLPQRADFKQLHHCMLCNKVFYNYSSLEIHMRQHTGKKFFACNICSKSFIVKSLLDRHKRTHTGERPFKCHYCDYKATQYCHLKRHIVGKHSEVMQRKK